MKFVMPHVMPPPQGIPMSQAFGQIDENIQAAVEYMEGLVERAEVAAARAEATGKWMRIDR